MTWRKTGAEFDDECAHVDLSDPAYRTHMEAIGHIYSVSALDCRFAKKRVLKFSNSEEATTAVRELLDHGFWIDHGDQYEVVHHADVIRQSLAAQGKKLVRDKKAQQARREKERQASNNTPETPSVSADVSADTDRQTDKQLESDPTTTCSHGFHPSRRRDPWLSIAACDLCQSKTARRSA